MILRPEHGRKRRVLFFSCLAVTLLAPEGRAAAAELQSTLIRDVPFVQQRPDFCGEACVEMALRRQGHTIDQDEVFDTAGVDPALGRGVLAKELARALRQLGIDPGAVWFRVGRNGDAEVKAQLEALHADLRAGIPSIVCMHYDSSPRTTEHFRLILGYDAKRDELIYHEPAEPRGAYRRMPRRTFLALWPLPYTDNHRIVIRLRLPPGQITRPARVGQPGYRPADYAQHVLALRERLRTVPGKFTVMIEPPFVVASDLSREGLRGYSKALIRRAVDSFKAEYFTKDPAHIIDIWLFKDRTSYRANALRLFGDRPDTPFGYYSPSDHALVMNIKTGGGTLVHELVHPFVEANFPGAPPWLNEGLGSLYEGVGWPRGKIWGFPNWRLPGLQEAIRQRALPGLEELMRQSEAQFYGPGSGTHYAEARYLLYYLQDRGLLRTFYHRFLQNRASDPDGVKTLKQVLQIEDLRAFQREWERYVSKLSWK